jgi:formylglycine-generating enzyme required for sulfatase activity
VGDYTVVVSFGSLTVTSSPASLVILAPFGHLVRIPAGTFVMGSPDSEVDRSTNEAPQTTVTLSRGFWMGTYEVTQQEFSDVMGTNPSHFTGSLDRPVEFLSWTDANNYCDILTQRERAAGRIPGNHVYRLPTEAEWEYACRARTTMRFSYGDDPGYVNLAAYAWYLDNGADTTHPVGGKLPNPWGLYDMYGNVWEWCQDWLAAYPGGSVTDPVVGSATGSNPIVRGGSYAYGGAICRSAKRGAMSPPTGMRWDVGLRAVLVRTGP